jgi:hypothetical protein
MEMSQGNSLCSHLKHKCHFFSFTKSEKRRAEQVPSGVGVGTGGKGQDVGKRCWEGECGASTVHTVFKWKRGEQLKLF